MIRWRVAGARHWVSRRTNWLVASGALAVILLAVLVRFHALGAQSFWNDEGNSYVQSTRTLADIAANAARDIHPPGYYALLAGWRLVGGESEFALRLLSALASVLTVAFTFGLGKRLFSAGAGLAAALLVALNSFSIYYAQEARMYALLALWGVMSMWVLAAFVRRPSRRWGLALALVNAAGLWTQYAFAFVMLAQGVLIVIRLLMIGRRREIRAFAYLFGVYTVSSLLTIVLFLPWLPTALDQMRTWPSSGIPVTFAEALGGILNLLTFGTASAYASPGALGVTNFLLLFGLLALLPKRSSATWRTLVPVLWVLVTIGVFLAFRLYRPQNLKLLLPAQIGMALWLARGLWVLWRLRVRPTAPVLRALPKLAALLGGAWLALNLSAGIAPLQLDPAYRRADYRAIATTITSELREGDAIILDAPNQQEVFRYYFKAEAPIYTLPAGLGGDDAATRAALETILAAHQRAFAVYWGETERDPNRVVEQTLDQKSFEVSDTWYGDVRLTRYEMPATLPAPTLSGEHFGDHITLAGYALNAETVKAGDVVQVQLNWQTDARLDQRYKVFLQLLDESGKLVAQRDSEPGGGLALTTTWTPGEVVRDLHGLLIPSDLPPAHYLLIVGLYNLNDAAARLPVGDNTYLTLTTLTLH